MHRIAFATEELQQDRKLIPGQPAQLVGFADRPAQTQRHGGQNLIAGGVTPGIVHRFEAVDVDQQNGNGATMAVCLRQCRRHFFAKCLMIQQTGQQVLLGHCLKSRLIAAFTGLRRLQLGLSVR